MFHHLFNDFYKKTAASSQSRMKTTKKNMCLVFGVFQSGFNYHLKYLNNVHLCKKSPHKSGDFFMHKEENIWTFVYWLGNRWRGDNVTTEMKQIGGVIVWAQLDFQLKFMYFACGEIHVVFPLFHMPNINSFSVASEESHCWINWHSKVHGTANEPRKKFQSVRLLEPKQQ